MDQRLVRIFGPYGNWTWFGFFSFAATGRSSHSCLRSEKQASEICTIPKAPAKTAAESSKTDGKVPFIPFHAGDLVLRPSSLTPLIPSIGACHPPPLPTSSHASH